MLPYPVYQYRTSFYGLSSIQDDCVAFSRTFQTKIQVYEAIKETTVSYSLNRIIQSPCLDPPIKPDLRSLKTEEQSITDTPLRQSTAKTWGSHNRDAKKEHVSIPLQPYLRSVVTLLRCAIDNKEGSWVDSCYFLQSVYSEGDISEPCIPHAWRTINEDLSNGS